MTSQNEPTLLPAALSEQSLADLGLSTQDIDAINQASKALQDIAPGNLSGYGRDATSKTSAFSVQLLDKVRNADLDTSGDKLGEVVRIARSLNLDSFSERSKLPILGPLIDKLKATKGELVQKYSSTNKQIDQLMGDVSKTQQVQQQRVREYDQMHALVLDERRELGIHVAAGRVRIAELEQELAALAGMDDPASRTRRSELDTALRLIDKRVSDLQVLQHAAEQTLPMIRLIQANAIQLIEKFAAVRDITIPMWRNQFAIQLSLADQRNAVDLANAIDDASNELMRKNAELVHGTAQPSHRRRHAKGSQGPRAADLRQLQRNLRRLHPSTRHAQRHGCGQGRALAFVRRAARARRLRGRAPPSLSLPGLTRQSRVAASWMAGWPARSH